MSETTNEGRIAQLETLVGELTSQITELGKTIEEQKAASTPSGDLEKTVAQQTKQLDQLGKTVTQQNKVIEALSKKVKEKADVPEPEKKPELPKETFEVDGIEYKFIAPRFNHKNEKITAVDALANKTILAELVAMKAGVIVEVEQD